MQESRTQPTHNDELSFGRTVTIALVILIGVVTVIALMSGGAADEPEEVVAKTVPTEPPAQREADSVSTPPVKTPTREPEHTDAAPIEKPSPETKQVEDKPEESAKPTEPLEPKPEENKQAQVKVQEAEATEATSATPVDNSSSSGESQNSVDRVAVKKPVVTATDAEATPEPAAEVNGSTSAAEQPTAPRPEHESLTLKGRVVWLNSLLKDRFGIGTAADAKQQSLALDSTDGNIYPIVEDARGHAFRLDDRLRERPVEVLVRRYDGSPMIQVIRLYAIREDGKYELDYWCDICAIQMFQPGDCSCCQAKNRLRERKVEEE